MPEIRSEMETNHTRVSGVSHCKPLNEQPITAKPNAYLGLLFFFIDKRDVLLNNIIFLGYIPEQTSLPSIYAKPSYDQPVIVSQAETPNQIEPKLYSSLREDQRRNEPYETERAQHLEGTYTNILITSYV